MLPGKRIYSIAGAALLLVALLIIGAFSTGLFQEERVFIPADQVTAAVQTAVSNTPGNVGGVEVENEEGQTLVEVYVQDQSGEVSEVAVNPQTNQVVNHEEEDEGDEY